MHLCNLHSVMQPSMCELGVSQLESVEVWHTGCWCMGELQIRLTEVILPDSFQLPGTITSTSVADLDLNLIFSQCASHHAVEPL